MAREFLLAGVDPEELKPAPKIEPPKTPQGKWENFWYHYKWHFWGILFGVVVLTVLVVQMLSRNPADYEILLVTENALIDTQIELIEQELAAYGEDLDGDGKVEIHIQNCYLSTPGSQQYYTQQQVLQTRIFSGDVMFYMWEPKQYKNFMKNITTDGEETKFFHPLPFEHEAIVEDGRVYNWDTAALREKNPILEKMAEELYLGVRMSEGTAAEKTALRDRCLALLEGFATGKKVNAPQTQPTK